MEFKLKNKIPTEVGWYWFYSGRKYDDVEIVYVRRYGSDLAVGNNTIVNNDYFTNGVWSEKIPEPINSTDPAIIHKVKKYWD